MRTHSQPQPVPLSPEQLGVLEDLGYLLDEASRTKGGWQALDPAGQPVRLRLISLPAGPQRAARLRHLGELRRLRHPGLARLESLHELPGGLLVAACEYVEGTDLAVVLGARGRLRRDEAAQLLADLGSALAHLHEQGLVHGDVSAANTVITPQGHAVLIDLLADAQEQGTPGAAAPERLRGEAPSAAADVYALAAVVEQAVAASHTAAGALPLLADALSRDPGSRPTARELAERAERLAAPVPISLPQSAGLAAGMLRACAQVPTRRARRPWWGRRGRARGWGRGSRGWGRGTGRGEHGSERLSAARLSGSQAAGLLSEDAAEAAVAGAGWREPGRSTRLRQAARSWRSGRHRHPGGGPGRGRYAARSGAAPLRRRGRPWSGLPVTLGLLLTLVVMVPLLAFVWVSGAWTQMAEGSGGSSAVVTGAAASETSPATAGPTARLEPDVATSPLLPGAGATAPAGPQDEDLLRAVVQLARSRDAALESGDLQALASTTVPGSGAASADQQVLESLRDSGQTVTGLRTQLQEVKEVPVADLPLSTPAPAEARAVRATLSQAPHQRHADERTWTVPVQSPRQVVLVLVPEPWRVLEVLEVQDNS